MTGIPYRALKILYEEQTKKLHSMQKTMEEQKKIIHKVHEQLSHWTKKIMRDLEMIKLDPVGKAWAAVKDMNDINAVMTKGKTSNIKRAIMPDYALWL